MFTAVTAHQLLSSRLFAKGPIFKNIEQKLCQKLYSSKEISKMTYRLNPNIRPTLYDLFLHPNLNNSLFNGTVKIRVNILEAAPSIVLHSNGLNITNVKVGGQSTKYGIEPKYEIFEIINENGSKFSKGDNELEIEFNGDMKNRIVGLYTSKYLNKDNESVTIATSKFEPTYARQAFPCFDEPNLKAKYKVHLLKPKNDSYNALSNYPVEKIVPYDENHELVTFQETVSMSTYLTCFIVSDFINIETTFDNSGKQLPLKVYASPGNLEKISYAADTAKKIIEYYVKYFGIAYPLPKLDLVAIPDFVSGAMENWGLITYRETALLYTNTTHSTKNKQRVATVISHELAHSWFGNLVTMNWWNDLWLNEGFATYISCKGVDAVEPKFNTLSQFQMMYLMPVLSYDAGLTSHPIVVDVVTPDQITSIFDVISYNKGASILRMLEGTVGAENFRNGVKNYLLKYAYGNAVTKNFLDEIQNVVGSKMNISEIMDTFTVQMGYPIINVTYDEKQKTYKLTQKRFLKDPGAKYDENDSKYRYKWSVPITYVTNLGKSEIIVFPYSQESITIPKPENSTWFKINSDQVGYYRVSYDEALWQSLINSYNELNVFDRTHLLDDAFSIASTGQLNYSTALELTKKLTNELDYTPWSVASTKLLVILGHLRSSSSDQQQAFKTYIQRIIKDAYENLTWNENPEEPDDRKLTRVEVLSTACTVEHAECLAEVAKKFNSWISNPSQPLSQDLREIVYEFGMKNANEETWNKLLDIYITERDASEKIKLADGLASVRNDDLLKKFLELTKNESIIRSQDYFLVLNKIARNPVGTDLVWNFIRENWSYLVKRFSLNNRIMGNFIPALANRFSTAEKLAEFEAFFKKFPEAGAGARGRTTAIENIKNNIGWLESYKIPVETWIKATVNES